MEYNPNNPRWSVSFDIDIASEKDFEAFQSSIAYLILSLPKGFSTESLAITQREA